MRGKLLFLPLLFLISAGAGATALPPIIADADNTVPKCVTPAALMQFVAERNARHQPPLKIASRFESTLRVTKVSVNASRVHRKIASAFAGIMLSSRC